MPELPDIRAYLTALEPRILGARLERIRIASPFVLRTAAPPVSTLEGALVRELRRIGKRIAIGFERELWLVLHLMIAGRLHWKGPHARLQSRQLAALDFSEGTLVLSEAGTQHRASIHLAEGADAVAAFDAGGIEVLGCDPGEFRARLAEESRTLKRALTDPRLLSGIGNAYSDEILHAARLSPLALTSKLDDGEWSRLYQATQDVLRTWSARLEAEARRAFPERVTAFRPDMAVHGRFGKPCPRCNDPVQRIRYANRETNYCARCQTGGRLLADRGLSRLLGADWPRTLEELETLRRR
jgi:formamidopyrimidine-DNA glycosylase